MVNLITQARNAADEHHWSTVVNLLQELLMQQDSLLDNAQAIEWVNLATQVLECGDFQERWDVAKVFPAFGEAAIVPLVELLQDEDADLEGRWFAARVLGELNHPSAIRVLVEQVQNSDDDDLSKAAAEALTHLGLPAIAALTELLTQEETRRFAIQALAQIHQPEAIPALLSVVEDSDPTIRAMALDALTSFRDARIPSVLLKAVNDPATMVRRAAIAGLGMRAHQLDGLDSVSVLSKALWDVNLSVSRQAVLSLGRLQQDAAIPPLKRALEAPNTPVSLQMDIVRALCWIGTEAALHGLKTILLDSEKRYPTEVYQEVITSLGLWSDAALQPTAVHILIEFLTSQTKGVESATLRQASTTALGQLKQPFALDTLIQILADPDLGVQFHAIAALKALEPGVVLARLQEVQQEATSERLQAGIRLALREWQIELPHSFPNNS